MAEITKNAIGMTVVVLFTMAGCGGKVASGPQPVSIDGYEVKVYIEWGAGEHRESDVKYHQTPPATGPHSPIPAQCGTYAKQLPDENFVHTLEHGAVAILFRPDVAEAEVEEIESFAADQPSHFLSAPYEGMSSAIAVVSWNRSMFLETFDQNAVRDYLDRFADQAPETGIPCPNEVHGTFLD